MKPYLLIWKELHGSAIKVLRYMVSSLTAYRDFTKPCFLCLCRCVNFIKYRLLRDILQMNQRLKLLENF